MNNLTIGAVLAVGVIGAYFIYSKNHVAQTSAPTGQLSTLGAGSGFLMAQTASPNNQSSTGSVQTGVSTVGDMSAGDFYYQQQQLKEMQFQRDITQNRETILSTFANQALQSLPSSGTEGGAANLSANISFGGETLQADIQKTLPKSIAPTILPQANITYNVGAGANVATGEFGKVNSDNIGAGAKVAQSQSGQIQIDSGNPNMPLTTHQYFF